MCCTAAERSDEEKDKFVKSHVGLAKGGCGRLVFSVKKVEKEMVLFIP